MLYHTFKQAMLSGCHRLCPLCGLALIPHERDWCEYCRMIFEPRPRCQRCGLPAASDVIMCGHCLTTPPLWHRLYCIGDYAFPLDTMIHQIKHQRMFWQLPSLAGLLAERIDHPAPLMTFVPLHWQRRWFRGFNQSELLAGALNQHWQNTTTALFSRTQSTPPQQSLNKKQRQNNLKNVFTLTNRPTHSHVAIVDDVVTTGTTISELCKLLLAVGVEYIDIYCISRTPDTL